MGIVIIGAGQAGMQAAFSLRQSGYQGELTLIGDESVLPYQRPPLSKLYLQGEMPLERLWLRKKDIYEQHHIVLKWNHRLVKIHKAEKTVEIQHENAEQRMRYDTLILATGGAAFRLPVMGSQLPHIHLLRTLQDADAIIAALARSPKNIVVIGSGFIGLEAAASMRKMGHQVTILTNSRLMERAVCQDMSDFYHDVHSAHGVSIHIIKDIEKIDADNVTADGKIFPADFIVMGVGIKANIDAAQDAGLAIDKGGILTNAYGRCQGESDIYAVGDCAAFPVAWADGAVMRIESVQNAIDMAKIAAAHIVHEEILPQPLLWFWSGQYDCKLQIAGLSVGATQIIIRGSRADRKFSCFYLRDKKIIAVDSVNQGKDHMIARKLIPLQREIADSAKIADMDFDLKSLMP